MEINYLMLAIFIIIVVFTALQVQKRINFDQGITYGLADLIKHKDYKSFNIWGIIIGVFLIATNAWKLLPSDFPVTSPLSQEVLGVINGISAIFTSCYKPSNYTAVSKSGIDIDGTQIKWEKMMKVYKNEFSFIIATKKTNYFIDFADLNDKEDFRIKLGAAVNKYNQLDSVMISI